MTTIIVDYGQGNLGSIQNMLARLGYQSHISSDPAEVAASQRLILPGIGAFDTAMVELDIRGLREPLVQRAIDAKVPTLGICLGAQLMTKGSEEGSLPGLGWFDAETVAFKFTAEERLPVPNIGWRDVRAAHGSTLISGLDEARYYFVHSYYMRTSADNPDTALYSDYGHSFVCGFQRDNLYSAQFHPEKSHKFGFHFLKAFMHAP